jgi:hypothetical protein
MLRQRGSSHALCGFAEKQLSYGVVLTLVTAVCDPFCKNTGRCTGPNQCTCIFTANTTADDCSDPVSGKEGHGDNLDKVYFQDISMLCSTRG